jgi:hypothetical protein
METRRLRERLGLMSIGALMMDPQFVRRAAQDRSDDVVADGESPPDELPTLRTRWHTGWDRWRLRLTRGKP